MNTTLPYHFAVTAAAEMAPELLKPGVFIRWAEDIAELISKIYMMDYDQVVTDLTDKCKEEQDYDDYDD